ncbi:MAG: acyl-CoA dehydrogenase [Deltaproteobacteria bacterium]|jgi:acyl-CoA dehydrogenase|nr:acyl-CoA dehydrogenase [Deltaproteobacteria bacterium]MBT4267479.1 acyl-CoA dehydrogenase [Deltaproteobacteria bacterium]MBT4644171.1 acyl-CoA dehydrogenase [Deltaproteobacteria bacterium]MBT6500173.1 acyl-CoA dehydrogenase [Deltaproteobacteria bacterium]MBT7152209.1 acyl-CoA dehydrogenase [Deltaproteobacteria bacterium]
MILLNPKTETYAHLDEKSRQIMLKTIDFFENKGKQKVIDDFNDKVWYADFLEFLKENQIFATLLTPAGYGDKDARWDTRRICDFNEILGFYGLSYWYTWQVSILGLGPIWMSNNEKVKQKTAQLLKDGAIFAFGLSEKQHGADIYASDMSLITIGEGKYMAEGGKYYIGNANEAALVSVFGKNSETDEYVFFVVDSQHPNYDCVKNTVSSQNYVAEFALNSYPITENEILHTGRDAWDASLNTINVGKYNLGWGSIGICGHAFYEALNHASHRKLFNSFVTDFPHIKKLFSDAYCRLTAMKLFALRASDYMRSASKDDRRYLLYNPMVKMKVTTQGEEVINHLWDVIAAKGFEKDQYFSVAAIDIRALPKLEGTVHVNMALIIKFMPNYFFNPGQFPEIPERIDATNDDFLFQQGPTKGLGSIQFHDFNLAYDSVDLPNISIFKQQIETFKEFMTKATPSGDQAKDVDFLLIVGELFTLVAYGQLIIENAKIKNLDEDILDQIFDIIVRDFSKFALQLYSKANSTDTQMEICLRMIEKPFGDPSKFDRVWNKYIISKKDIYNMND